MEKARQELQNFKAVIRTWADSYHKIFLTDFDGKSGWEFLADEFLRDVEAQLMPYVNKLFTSDCITPADEEEFYEFIASEFHQLRKKLKPGLWMKLHYKLDRKLSIIKNILK